MTQLTKYELEEVLEELEKHKGSHTELISVYISAGYDAVSVQKQLEAEKSTAKNIKSTSTRKNVIDALEKIVRYLKDLKKTPENGLAVFAGNVSPTEGQSDLKIWDIEPPQPLRIRMYRCDKAFVLEPLKEQLEVTEVFALIVMDRKEATIGILEGKHIDVLHKMTSGVPSKVKAGGQSAQRFHRITEGLTKEFYKRIAEQVKELFFENKKLKGILVGGPIPTKDEWVEGKYLATQLSDKIIGVRDIGGSDESGLKELVERSKDILSNQEIVKEKKLLEKFFQTLGERPGFAVYDLDGIRKAMEYGAVELLLLTKDYDRTVMKELKQKAESISATVEIISNESEEGKQFKQLSGIGAILRFQIK